jgi:hypothetical protein
LRQSLKDLQQQRLYLTANFPKKKSRIMSISHRVKQSPYSTCHFQQLQDCKINRPHQRTANNALKGHRTSRDPQHSHHANDGRVDRNYIIFHLFQDDTDDRQDDNRHIQLVPSSKGRKNQSINQSINQLMI